jgi:fibronectin-binding autotransporter adhesin
MKPNRKNPILLASLTFALTLAAPSAFATDLYWDTDDATAGSGGATPSGSWATSGTTWSTDTTGATAVTGLTTTRLDHLFFSTGTDANGSYSVSLGSDQSARSLTFEEGAATLTGSTLSLADGGITVLAGAGNATISSNLTLSGNNIFNVGTGRSLTLDTGTLNRNANRATVNIQGEGNVSSTMTGLSANVANITGPWASFTAGGTTTYAKFVDSTISGLGYTGGADGVAVTASTSVAASTSNTNYSLNAVGNLAISSDIRTLRYTGATGSLVVRTSFTTRGIMNVSGNQLDINSNGGTVKAGTTSAAEMVVNAVSGDIRFVGTGSFTGNIVKTGSSALTFGQNANFSNITGITVNEGTFVTDAGTDNQLVGATINRGGTLRWARNNKHRDDAVFTINAGGILDLNAQTDTVGSIAGVGSITSTNAATMTLSGGTQAFSGVIGGAVSLALNLTPSSALTLSGANTYSGATMVSAGTLFVTGSLASDVAVNANATLGGGGTVGALSFDGGSYFDIFDAISGNPLDSITIGIGSAGFGIDNLVSQGAAVNWGAIADGTYNLITGTLDSLNLDNFGLANAFDIDGISGSRSAYFQNGSLQLVVIPEPHAALLGGLSLLALLRRRRKY